MDEIGPHKPKPRRRHTSSTVLFLLGVIGTVSSLAAANSTDTAAAVTVQVIANLMLLASPFVFLAEWIKARRSRPVR